MTRVRYLFFSNVIVRVGNMMMQLIVGSLLEIVHGTIRIMVIYVIGKLSCNVLKSVLHRCNCWRNNSRRDYPEHPPRWRVWWRLLPRDYRLSRSSVELRFYEYRWRPNSGGAIRRIYRG